MNVSDALLCRVRVSNVVNGHAANVVNFELRNTQKLDCTYKKFRMDGVAAGSFDDGRSSNKRAFQRWKELSGDGVKRRNEAAKRS
jgi:hypothetical protein